MISELQSACYSCKIPLSVYALHMNGKEVETLQAVVSPQIVGYEGDTRTFYDLQNVLSGNFKTIPKSLDNQELDEDPFA